VGLKRLLLILATWEAEIRRIKVEGQRRELLLETPIFKITRAKSIESVAQAVECLFCKCDALRSNPGTIKKKSNSSSL
jgi:hypothetical protein